MYWSFMQKTDSFTYKASIDWIELEITTVNDSNFNSIKHLFNVNYVKPISPKGGGATNKFTLRIQDVTSWNMLDEIVNIVDSSKKLSSVLITGVEISFDAFSKNNDKQELIEKAAEFYFCLEKPCSKNRRLAGARKGSAEQPLRHETTIRKISEGNSIYIGSQNEDTISQRIYYKTKDNNKLLPIELHRARYELILVGDDCPFGTIEEARKYNFTELSGWFKFRKIIEDIDGLGLMLIKATRQLGQVNVKRLAGGGVKVNNCGTKADVYLNRIAYEKLRELTKRLNKTRVTRKLRVINSVNLL
jgi:hypothetical protein